MDTVSVPTYSKFLHPTTGCLSIVPQLHHGNRYGCVKDDVHSVNLEKCESVCGRTLAQRPIIQLHVCVCVCEWVSESECVFMGRASLNERQLMIAEEVQWM